MAIDSKNNAEVQEQSESNTAESSPNLAADFVFTIFLGILVVVFFIEASDYAWMSAIAPYIVMVPLLLLLVIHAIKLGRNVSWNAVTQFTKTLVTVSSEAYRKIGMVILWTVVLIVLMYLTGYYVGSLIYLFVMLRMVARESWSTSVSLMVSIPVALYIVFEMILGLQLYRGIIYMIWQGYNIF